MQSHIGGYFLQIRVHFKTKELNCSSSFLLIRTTSDWKKSVDPLMFYLKRLNTVKYLIMWLSKAQYNVRFMGLRCVYTKVHQVLENSD